MHDRKKLEDTLRLSNYRRDLSSPRERIYFPAEMSELRDHTGKSSTPVDEATQDLRSGAL